jgi:predicted transcriptional regulator
MKPEPSLYDQADQAAEEAADAEALADITAGRVVPNDEVCNWLRTWGTPDEKPPPPEWFK